MVIYPECKRGHSMLREENLIFKPRATLCRSCANGRKGAERRGLSGPEREAFISQHADAFYAKLSRPPLLRQPLRDRSGTYYVDSDGKLRVIPVR